VGALTDWLSSQESQRSLTVGTRSFEAHDHLLRGRELMRGPDGVTRENVEQIIAAIERAIALDPDYSLPYADLAVLHCIDYQNRLTGNPNPLDAALHCAEEALDRGPDDPEAHFAAANVAIWRHDLAAARAETERALALNPNYAMAYGMRGNIDVYLGTPESAVLDFQHALRLDPFFKHQTLHFLGTAYLVCADYEAAVAAFRARIELNRKTDLSRGFLIAALGHLGLVREARRVIGELKQINPNYSLAEHLARLPFQAEAHRERIRAGAVKAGYAS
jgi:adenylate cyclase